MNPAVTRLFEAVENPILVASALAALQTAKPLNAKDLPTPLVEPLFVLSAAAREMAGAPLVDTPATLRERIEEEDLELRGISRALFDGASFNTQPPKFSERATMNCEPGEVKLEFLPEGARFRSGSREGQLIYKTPSRAMVEWNSGPQSKTFKNHQAGGTEGVDVTITTSGKQRTGCALDAPVTPIFSVVAPEDRAWAVNAWKEITGVFSETEETSKPKSKRASAK